uniref:Uncharacterized protein n=1 Tax=Lepeophtheirus salmonis TaxID=72036 RepID=A0A0K2VFW3_LEPSM
MHFQKDNIHLDTLFLQDNPLHLQQNMHKKLLQLLNYFSTFCKQV